jgi:hypothetical protein
MNKIQDINIPTKGIGKYLIVRALTFDLTPTDGISLYWAIQSETLIEDEPKPGQTLLDGNLQLPQSMYEQWGTDDSVIVEWAAQQLNVTLI